MGYSIFDDWYGDWKNRNTADERGALGEIGAAAVRSITSEPVKAVGEMAIGSGADTLGEGLVKGAQWAEQATGLEARPNSTPLVNSISSAVSGIPTAIGEGTLGMFLGGPAGAYALPAAGFALQGRGSAKEQLKEQGIDPSSTWYPEIQAALGAGSALAIGPFMKGMGRVIGGAEGALPSLGRETIKSIGAMTGVGAVQSGVGAYAGTQAGLQGLPSPIDAAVQSIPESVISGALFPSAERGASALYSKFKSIDLTKSKPTSDTEGLPAAIQSLLTPEAIDSLKADFKKNYSNYPDAESWIRKSEALPTGDYGQSTPLLNDLFAGLRAHTDTGLPMELQALKDRSAGITPAAEGTPPVEDILKAYQENGQSIVPPPAEAPLSLADKIKAFQESNRPAADAGINQEMPPPAPQTPPAMAPQHQQALLEQQKATAATDDRSMLVQHVLSEIDKQVATAPSASVYKTVTNLALNRLPAEVKTDVQVELGKRIAAASGSTLTHEATTSDYWTFTKAMEKAQADAAKKANAAAPTPAAKVPEVKAPEVAAVPIPEVKAPEAVAPAVASTPAPEVKTIPTINSVGGIKALRDTKPTATEILKKAPPGKGQKIVEKSFTEANAAALNKQIAALPLEGTRTVTASEPSRVAEWNTQTKKWNYEAQKGLRIKAGEQVELPHTAILYPESQNIKAQQAFLRQKAEPHPLSKEVVKSVEPAKAEAPPVEAAHKLSYDSDLGKERKPSKEAMSKVNDFLAGLRKEDVSNADASLQKKTTDHGTFDTTLESKRGFYKHLRDIREQLATMDSLKHEAVAGLGYPEDIANRLTSGQLAEITDKGIKYAEGFHKDLTTKILKDKPLSWEDLIPKMIEQYPLSKDRTTSLSEATKALANELPKMPRGFVTYDPASEVGRHLEGHLLTQGRQNLMKTGLYTRDQVVKMPLAEVSDNLREFYSRPKYELEKAGTKINEDMLQGLSQAKDMLGHEEFFNHRPDAASSDTLGDYLSTIFEKYLGSFPRLELNKKNVASDEFAKSVGWEGEMERPRTGTEGYTVTSANMRQATAEAAATGMRHLLEKYNLDSHYQVSVTNGDVPIHLPDKTTTMSKIVTVIPMKGQESAVAERAFAQARNTAQEKSLTQHGIESRVIDNAVYWKNTEGHWSNDRADLADLLIQKYGTGTKAMGSFGKDNLKLFSLDAPHPYYGMGPEYTGPKSIDIETFVTKDGRVIHKAGETHQTYDIVQKSLGTGPSKYFVKKEPFTTSENLSFKDRTVEDIGAWKDPGLREYGVDKPDNPAIFEGNSDAALRNREAAAVAQKAQAEKAVAQKEAAHVQKQAQAARLDSQIAEREAQYQSDPKYGEAESLLKKYRYDFGNIPASEFEKRGFSLSNDVEMLKFFGDTYENHMKVIDLKEFFDSFYPRYLSAAEERRMSQIVRESGGRIKVYTDHAIQRAFGDIKESLRTVFEAANPDHPFKAEDYLIKVGDSYQTRLVPTSVATSILDTMAKTGADLIWQAKVVGRLPNSNAVSLGFDHPMYRVEKGEYIKKVQGNFITPELLGNVQTVTPKQILDAYRSGRKEGVTWAEVRPLQGAAYETVSNMSAERMRQAIDMLTDKYYMNNFNLEPVDIALYKALNDGYKVAATREEVYGKLLTTGDRWIHLDPEKPESVWRMQTMELSKDFVDRFIESEQGKMAESASRYRSLFMDDLTTNPYLVTNRDGQMLGAFPTAKEALEYSLNMSDRSNALYAFLKKMAPKDSASLRAEKKSGRPDWRDEVPNYLGYSMDELSREYRQARANADLSVKRLPIDSAEVVSRIQEFQKSLYDTYNTTNKAQIAKGKDLYTKIIGETERTASVSGLDKYEKAIQMLGTLSPTEREYIDMFRDSAYSGSTPDPLEKFKEAALGFNLEKVSLSKETASELESLQNFERVMREVEDSFFEMYDRYKASPTGLADTLGRIETVLVSAYGETNPLMRDYFNYKENYPVVYTERSQDMLKKIESAYGEIQPQLDAQAKQAKQERIKQKIAAWQEKSAAFSPEQRDKIFTTFDKFIKTLPAKDIVKAKEQERLSASRSEDTSKAITDFINDFSEVKERDDSSSLERGMLQVLTDQPAHQVERFTDLMDKAQDIVKKSLPEDVRVLLSDRETLGNLATKLDLKESLRQHGVGKEQLGKEYEVGGLSFTHKDAGHIIVAASDNVSGVRNLAHESAHVLLKLMRVMSGKAEVQAMKVLEKSFGNEEHIANAYADYFERRYLSLDQPLSYKGLTVKTVFEKVANFFEKVKNALTGLGYHSSSDIFGTFITGKLSHKYSREVGKPLSEVLTTFSNSDHGQAVAQASLQAVQDWFKEVPSAMYDAYKNPMTTGLTALQRTLRNPQSLARINSQINLAFQAVVTHMGMKNKFMYAYLQDRQNPNNLNLEKVYRDKSLRSTFNDLIIETDKNRVLLTPAQVLTFATAKGMDAKQAQTLADGYTAWNNNNADMKKQGGRLLKDALARYYSDEPEAVRNGLRDALYNNGQNSSGIARVDEILNHLIEPLQKIITWENRKVDGTYLARIRDNGSYHLVIEDPKTNTYLRQPFDHQFQLEREYTKAVSKYGKDVVEKKIVSNYSPEYYESRMKKDAYDLLTSTALNLEKKGTLSDKEISYMFSEMVNAISGDFETRGFKKHDIKRVANYYEGFKKQDVFENYTTYLSSLSGFLAKSHSSVDFKQVLKGINTESPEYSYIQRYFDDYMRNSAVVDRIVNPLRSVAFVKYLGGRLSNAALQLTQNYILGAPFAARMIRDMVGNDIPFNANRRAIVEYTKAIGDATKVIQKTAWKSVVDLSDLVKNKTLSPEEASLLYKAISEGHTNSMHIQFIQGEFKTGLGGTMQKAVDITSMPFSKAEELNRTASFLAMIRLQKEFAPGRDASRAYNTAIQHVYDTHFMYGKGNLPEMLRGGGFASSIMKLAYTFRSYPHNYILGILDSMKSDGKFKPDVAIRSMAMLLALGGATSIPFLDDLLGLFERKTGVPVRKKMYDWMQKSGGTTFRNFGEAGIGGLLGIDLSPSMRIDLPFVGAKGNETKLFGVYGGIDDSLTDAVAKWKIGDYGKALADLAPGGIAAPLKAYTSMNQGVTSKDERVMLDPTTGKPVKINGYEALLNSLGFNPLSVTTVRREKEVFANMEGKDSGYYTTKLDEIKQQMRYLSHNGELTGDALLKTQQKLKDLAEKAKENGVSLSTKVSLKSLKDVLGKKERMMFRPPAS